MGSMGTTGDGEGRGALIMHALRGTGGDPTRGPLGRAILLLAIPMVLEMVMESVFAVVDVFFVSRLGDEALAGVALTESVLTLVYTVAIGLSIGVTATVARRTGERDPEGAALATGQALLVGAGLAAVLGVAGALGAGRLLALMGATPEVVAVARGYATIMIGGQVVIVLLFLLNAALRGAGDAAVAMRVLWIANAINIVLDPLLIFGIGPFPELGVTGAAVATTIGRGTGVAIQLFTLFRLNGRLRLEARHLVARPDVMGRLVRLSGTGTFQVFVGTASWIGLVRLISEFGSEALAGYTIAIRIVLFALLPAWGLGSAAATMVGQGLGAGDPDRAERAVWLAARMNLAFLGSIGVLFVVLAPAIVGMFGGSGEAAAIATRGLRIVSAGFFCYAFGMVVTQSFNGAGDTWTPTLLNLVCFWLCEIPLAWALAFVLGMGPEGAFVSVTVAFSLMAAASALLFRRGRWRTATV